MNEYAGQVAPKFGGKRFNRFHTTGVKKILGSWMTLPALAKNNVEKNVHLVLTEEKGSDGSYHIIALMK